MCRVMNEIFNFAIARTPKKKNLSWFVTNVTGCLKNFLDENFFDEVRKCLIELHTKKYKQNLEIAGICHHVTFITFIA